MANTKISALTSASAPLAGTETLPIVQSGATKQVSVSNLTAGRAVLAASLGLGNPANYSLTSYAPGANANYLQVANGSTGAGAGNGTLFGVDASGNGTISAQGAVSLNINVAGLETFNLDSSNNAKFSRGNLIQGTSAKGINFTANTPGANATSQLLNVYEQGTWVPSVRFGGATVGVTYGAGGAAYTRVGNLVTCTAYIVLTSKGSSTGNLEIWGLPYTVAAGANYSFGGVGTSGITFTGSIFGLLYPGTTYARIFQSTLLGVRSVVQDTAVTNTAEFSVQFSYQV